MKVANINLKNLLVLIAFVAIGATSLIVFLNNTSAASFFGAIYTSKSDGASVNQNLYDSKDDVYLNGGPQNANANGLPDGTYYFQVTNPSGSVLLSTDAAVCRQLSVVGGKVAGSTGPCPHPNGTPNSSNGSTPVKLQPFNDTTNNGGEYKVWLIRQASNTAVANDGIHINFIGSNAKTDNFKIKQTECIPGEDPECSPVVSIGGMKYYDANANGVKDNGEVPVVGVRIVVTLSGVPDPIIVETDANGNWVVNDIPNGTEYSVEEILPETCEDGSYWVQTGPVADGNGFQGYAGTANGNIENLDFGDICFHPASGGLTLGYWSNKNGEKTMQNGAVDVNVYPTATDNPAFPELGQGMPGDLNFLKRLNLKGEAVNKKVVTTVDFDPTSHAAFKSWILNANAYNMSYMLSGQLAATSLDVRHQFLSDSQLVDARGVCNSVGDCLGIITIGEVRVLANQSLGAGGGNTTISGSPHRDSQELMKNFLDDVNNNRLPFASAEPCGVCYLPPPTPTPEQLP